MDKIALIEPSWGVNILQWWIDIQEKYSFISDLAPVFADIFVLAYPAFLILVYLYAMIKKKVQIKQWAIYICIATFIAVVINIWVQTFFYKERPIVVMNNVETEETLLHDILPTSSFPSDHAVVSMTFAMATLLWWLYNRRKFFIWSWFFFIIISLIMTLCRILTLVHWPSDIFAWLLLWILVPLILMIRPIRYALLRYLVNPVIRFEQWFFGTLFNCEQPEV
jgi:membrane-associated phospholipid phosphatase